MPTLYFPLDKCWLLNSHKAQYEEIYARTSMDTGPDRTRRKYITVPQVRNASIFLTSDEAKTFHEWFEGLLQVGSRRFYAQFHDPGVGILWFEAEFVKPWEAEFVPLGDINAEGKAGRAWKINIELRIYGSGSLDKPDIDPKEGAFSVELRIPLVTDFLHEYEEKFAVLLECPLTFTSNFEKMTASVECPLNFSFVDTYRIQTILFVFYQGGAVLQGWQRFSVTLEI